jgi:hyperosmotically inducible protein
LSIRFRATARALAGASGNTSPTTTNPPGPATNAEQKAEHTSQKAENAVEGAMEKGEDAIITAKVKSALIADEKVGAMGINVDTVNEKVFLKGTVKTAGQKKLAEQIAKKTQGVKGVSNQLKVAP